ncbi:hypothetical protein HanRHA438_Chr13g0602331 [Helianthus annuus]|nr:hypothetical protein HanRHA438_Chr13g0602331 [Helianthus annuus]
MWIWVFSRRSKESWWYKLNLSIPGSLGSLGAIEGDFSWSLESVHITGQTNMILLLFLLISHL